MEGFLGNLLINGILAIFRQRKDWLNPDLPMEKSREGWDVLKLKESQEEKQKLGVFRQVRDKAAVSLCCSSLKPP